MVRFCDVVVRYRGVVRFHGVHQGSYLEPLLFPLCLPCSLVSVDIVVVVVHG